MKLLKFYRRSTHKEEGNFRASRKFSKPAKAIKSCEMKNYLNKCKQDEIQGNEQNVTNTSKDQHSKEEISTSAPTAQNGKNLMMMLRKDCGSLWQAQRY